MYVWYGKSEYNFETLPDPPAFEPTRCAQCGKVIHMGEDAYSSHGKDHWCERCTLKKIQRSRR